MLPFLPISAAAIFLFTANRNPQYVRLQMGAKVTKAESHQKAPKHDVKKI